MATTFPLMIGANYFVTYYDDSNWFKDQDIIMIAPFMYSYDELHSLIENHVQRTTPTEYGPMNDASIKSINFDALVVRWSLHKDSEFWPTRTVVTDENLNAILEMLKTRGGHDIMVMEYECEVN